MSNSNQDQLDQQDELSVIISMYNSETFYQTSPNHYTFLPYIACPSLSHLTTIRLVISLPFNYPSKSSPEFQLIENIDQGLPFKFVTDKVIKQINKIFNDLFIEGEVVIFNWILALEEYLIENGPTKEMLHSQRPIKKINSTSEIKLEQQIQFKEIKEIENNNLGLNISSGIIIEDRKSVFLGHCCKVTKISDIQLVLEQLLKDKKIAKATHNMYAFRIKLNNIVIQDNDDDGESAAGSRLLHLLQVLDVENIMVVVSRWYGGIPLSSDRFKHINNAARQVLDDNGYLKPKKITNKKK